MAENEKAPEAAEVAPERTCIVKTNPDKVNFALPTVYNLQALRKMGLTLVVKTARSPRHAAAVKETLEVLLAFLDTRVEQAAAQREVDVAAARAEQARRATAAAEMAEKEAQDGVARAREDAKKWTGILKAMGKKPAAAEKAAK